MEAVHLSIKRRYAAYRIRSFAVLWFVYGGYYLCRNCYFVAKPAIGSAMGISNAELGLIDLAFLSTYAVGQFINGPLGDRFNNKLMIGAGMMLSVLMAVLFGLSSTLPLFVLFWAINGYAQSTGWTSCVKSVDQWFTSRERGTVMGFWSTCYQVIGFFARILSAASIGWLGWRYAFFNPAAAMFLIAVVFLFVHANSPADAGLPPLDSVYGGSRVNEAGRDPAGAQGEESHGAIVKAILKTRTLWLVGVAFFCITFVRYAMMSWLARYLYDALRLSETTAGYLSAIPEIAGLFGDDSRGLHLGQVFSVTPGPGHHAHAHGADRGLCSSGISRRSGDLVEPRRPLLHLLHAARPDLHPRGHRRHGLRRRPRDSHCGGPHQRHGRDRRHDSGPVHRLVLGQVRVGILLLSVHRPVGSRDPPDRISLEQKTRKVKP